MPGLRQPPGSKQRVSFDDIVDALRSLDYDPDRPRPGGLAMRLKRPWRRDDGAAGTPLRYAAASVLFWRALDPVPDVPATAQHCADPPQPDRPGDHAHQPA